MEDLRRPNTYLSVKDASFLINLFFIIVVDAEPLKEYLVLVPRDSTLVSS